MANNSDAHYRQRQSPSHSSLIPEAVYPSTNHDNLTTNQQVLLSSILHELQAANALNQRLAATPPNKYDFLWTFLLQTFAVLTGIVFGVFAILAWSASKESNSLSSQSLSAATDANYLASGANVMGSSAQTLALQANAIATSAYVLAFAASVTQYEAQITASSQAVAANRMALLAYCINVPEGSTAARSYCSIAQSVALATLSSDVYSLFVSTPTISMTDSSLNPPTTPPFVTSTPSKPGGSATASASSIGGGSTASPAQNPGKIVGFTFGAAAAIAFVSFLWFLLWRSYQYRDRKARIFDRSKFRGSELSSQHNNDAEGGPGNGDQIQMQATGAESQQLLTNHGAVRH